MRNRIELLLLLSVLFVRSGLSAAAICVADKQRALVDRFDSQQMGDVPPISKFGWINEIEFSPAVAVDALHREIFVANQFFTSGFYTGSINVYDLDSLGNVAPIRRIFGPTTGLASPSGIAIDAVNDEIIVTNERGNLTVYPRSASGDAPPLRTLEWTGKGIALDSAHDEIFITSGDAVNVFPRIATGRATPLRSIGGLPSGLSHPIGIVVDNVHDEILVSNEGSSDALGSITVYPRTADGFVSPLRRITSPGQQMRQATAIALDLEHDEIAVATPYGIAVLTFPRSGTGQMPPLRQITRRDDFLQIPYGVAYDQAMDELIIVDNRLGGDNLCAVLKYPRLSSGSVPPRDSSDGRSTGLLNPVAMDVDAVNGEIWVANRQPPSLQVFQIDAEGDVRPLRSIEGSSTQLQYPIAVAVDPVHDEVLVSDIPYWIRVYPRSAGGNVAPLRTATLCNEPPRNCFPAIQLALDTVHGEMFAVFGSRVQIHPLPGEGYIAPRAVIQLTEESRGIAADPQHDEILIGTQSSILAYARTSTDLPIRQITSAYPKLLTLDSANDEILILLGELRSQSLAAYPRTGNGPVPALRRIAGRSLELSEASAISICTWPSNTDTPHR